MFTVVTCRSSHPELFLGKGALKICSKFTGEHSCRSAVSIKLQSSFIEITLWHGYSPVNLMHIFRTPFLKNTLGWLLLYLTECTFGMYRNACSQMFYRTVNQKCFSKLIGKLLRRPVTLMEKGLYCICFRVKFAKFYKTRFLDSTTK